MGGWRQSTCLGVDQVTVLSLGWNEGVGAPGV